jgi:hypothetical protein
MKKYKCLNEHCEYKLEKQYLYCGLECAIYDGYVKATTEKYMFWLIYHKIRRWFIYIIHMVWRLFI